MAGTLNKAMLIGRLGRDPELKYSAGGAPVCNFSMATDESYTDREGNRVDKAEWHRIVVFSRQAENCANYLSKGSQVFVEGRLQTRKWQDQQGQDRYTTEIVAQRVQFLDSKGASAGDEDYQGAQQGARPGGRPQRGGGQQRQQQKQDHGPPDNYPDDDMGPAFPSEASGMDDVPF